MIIELPWPPASLSGHNNGTWRSKSGLVAKHRAWAKLATEAVKIKAIDGEGDILVAMHFYPPDNRSDRCNFANRVKPYFDGIADALKVNDKHFLPSYHFHDVVKSGKVVVEI